MTTVVQSTTELIGFDLHKADRFIGRLTHLLDETDRPAVNIRLGLGVTVQISWPTFTAWVRACDWLSDLGADMATREIPDDYLGPIMIAEAQVGDITVAFTCARNAA
jgi:hypothetical protein